MVRACPLRASILKHATLIVGLARDLLWNLTLNLFCFLILDQYLLRSCFEIVLGTDMVENYRSLDHTLTLTGVDTFFLV